MSSGCSSLLPGGASGTLVLRDRDHEQAGRPMQWDPVRSSSSWTSRSKLAMRSLASWQRTRNSSRLPSMAMAAASSTMGLPPCRSRRRAVRVRCGGARVGRRPPFTGDGERDHDLRCGRIRAACLHRGTGVRRGSPVDDGFDVDAGWEPTWGIIDMKAKAARQLPGVGHDDADAEALRGGQDHLHALGCGARRTRGSGGGACVADALRAWRRVRAAADADSGCSAGMPAV